MKHCRDGPTGGPKVLAHGVLRTSDPFLIATQHRPSSLLRVFIVPSDGLPMVNYNVVCSDS